MNKYLKLSDVDSSNLLKAKSKIRNLLKTKFQYIYTEKAIDPVIDHLTFKMDSTTHNLQMTFEYNEKYCDILCFISPTVVSENSYIDTLRLVNSINWNVKAMGRYYIDDYKDIAYSLRLDYELLEKQEDRFLQEIETAIQYYEDVFMLILNVSLGKFGYDKAYAELNSMWN